MAELNNPTYSHTFKVPAVHNPSLVDPKTWCLTPEELQQYRLPYSSCENEYVTCPPRTLTSREIIPKKHNCRVYPGVSQLNCMYVATGSLLCGQKRYYVN